MTDLPLSTSLTINGLRLSVFLGVYPVELLKKQSVSLDVQVQFSQVPKACASDQLEDTYCYDKLTSHIKAQIATQRFQMIEYLAQELYRSIKAYFPPETKLSLRVTKQPAIADLAGGVSFHYGDKELAWSF